jgi:chemotaxis protein CheD
VEVAAPKRIFLSPGEVACTGEPTLITTVLGSCVAVTLWDPKRRFGGVNHFVLPPGKSPRDSARYGDVAMAELLQRMDGLGAKASNLRAKVFGGASVLSAVGQDSVGAANVRFALEELERHGIPVAARRVGGQRGRLLVFNTETGEAFVWFVAEAENLPSAP